MSDMPEKIYLDETWKVALNNCNIYDYDPGHDILANYTRSDLLPQWRPIDTAPKDGTVVLVYVKSKIFNDRWYEVSYFNDIYGGWYSGSKLLSDPTHWMPLPKEPESEG